MAATRKSMSARATAPSAPHHTIFRSHASPTIGVNLTLHQLDQVLDARSIR